MSNFLYFHIFNIDKKNNDRKYGNDKAHTIIIRNKI